MGLLAGGPWNASHASCERKVVVIPNHGRLGNQLFQFAVCYALALENGLCLKPNPAVCHAFALSGPWVGCHGSPRAPQQRRLKPPAAWWGAEDRKAVRRAVAAARGPTDFQCIGNRQNARVFRDLDLRRVLRSWTPEISDRADDLWRGLLARVRGRDAADAVAVVVLYRQGRHALRSRGSLGWSRDHTHVTD